MHEAGLAKLIDGRGGMRTLGPWQRSRACYVRVRSEMWTGSECSRRSVVYHQAIFCERPPLPLFVDHDPFPAAAFDPLVPLPESPLFCPREGFRTIGPGKACSKAAFDVVCHMRNLTDAFVSRYTVVSVEADGDDHTAYRERVARIRRHIFALPSAEAPDSGVHQDWVYECCRIAAIIYTAAIAYRVPFSIATTVIQALDDSARHVSHPSSDLVDALYRAYNKSDVGDLWGAMSGVLFWVTLVGAAAARASVGGTAQSQRRATWVRRCLVMSASRAMLKLVFPHPVPTLRAQKRMSLVQALVGTSTRRLAS